MATLIFLLALIPFHSCTLTKDMGKNQVVEGHFRLYTYPEEKDDYFQKNKKNDRKEIIFAVFNDFEGLIQPNKHIMIDPSQGEKYNVKIGGIAGLQGYLKILREEFKDSVMLINSGSIFSSTANVRETVFYANYVGLDVSGLSRSDFALPFKSDYVNRLDRYLSKANFKTVSSNLFNLEEAANFDLKNISRTAIVETNGVKVGHISMVAPAMAKDFDAKKLNKVYFQPMAANIISLANELRKSGAEVISLMVSHGIDCTSQISQSEDINYYKVNFQPKNDKVCLLYENELAETLKKLPPGMVDIVFTNGKDSKVANFISGYPVLQSYPGGEHLSWAKLVFDTKQKRIVKEQTQIMQPVQLCHKFFKETEDCYVKEVLRNVEIVPAKFLGKEVKVQALPTRR